MGIGRAILRLVGCVVLGLGTTVGVAWASAARVHVGRVRSNGDILGTEYRSVSYYYHTRFRGRTVERAAVARLWVGTCGNALRPYEQLEAFRAGTTRLEYPGRFPASWGRAPVVSNAPPPPGKTIVDVQEARGWPMLALWCEWAGPTPAGTDARVRGGIDLAPDATSHETVNVRALPCRPIWRGLLADTGVYAAGWGAVLLAPAAVRGAARSRRRRCGQCAGCGYDLGGLPAGAPCPECGRSAP